MLNCLKPPPGSSNEEGADSDGVIDFSRNKVLVQYNDLITSIHRLRSLVVSHPNPGLCKRLLSPLLLPLWALACWPNAEASVAEKLCTPALELLRIYIKLTPSPELILLLIQNLDYLGGRDKSNPEWMFKATGEGLVQIVDATQVMGTGGTARQTSLEDIDTKITKLLDLITSTFSEADTSTAFLELLKRWLNSAQTSKRSGILFKQESEQDPVTHLTEMKTLQAMMDKFPEKLATQPKHILDLVSQILAGSGESPDDDDEVTGVALSLLNMIITAPGFQRSRVDPDILTVIETSLDRLSATPSTLSQTATNLRLLLLYRDEIDPSATSTPQTLPTNRQIEDRKTYQLAISYITAPDSPPPVRSEGLNLIATLITASSPVLDIPGILVLLSTLIADADEYIYLRIIRLYTLLASHHHPSSVLRDLTDHFVDKRETHTLDARLRFGEALLQVIQRMGETFTGPLAQDTAAALVGVAGRRSYRPKTEARRERERKVQERKDKEAAEAWGGSVPDMSEPVTERERERNEILERIVEGWEGTRGEEDVRVRASALAVLGAAVEVNVAGLGQGVVAAGVDLCVSVLQMEGGVEKGILRRAAVLFVLSFVRALEEARARGKELGFGFGRQAQEDVMRTLRYVAETDNDGLVVQHAKDVVESLETWQVVKLLPAEGSQQQMFGEGLTKLAGLDINPERPTTSNSGAATRPRIEEIE